jgi:hypothetical protein
MTIHKIALGEIGVKVKGKLTTEHPSSTRIAFRFEGTVDPQGEPFDFSPFLKNRGNGTIPNTIGWFLQNGGVLGKFDIVFTGPVQIEPVIGVVNCTQK